MTILRLVLFAIAMSGFSSAVMAQKVELNSGDTVCYIGNTLADRMQHHGWLETYIHATLPEHNLTFRNLGFSGDELTTRPRSAEFGSADQWLSKCKADVVFAFFGYNEALNGPQNLDRFRKDLRSQIDSMRRQKYNDESPPRLVFFTPIGHENLKSPHLPDGAENNANLQAYSAAMQEVCKEKEVPCFDLFNLSGRLYQTTKEPLTMNGVHLLDAGNKTLAQQLIPLMFPGRTAPADDAIAELRQSVLDKNYYWFSRYRVVDGYNVFGGRSKLEWFGQSNADVMKREMEIFDVMTANRDKKVWATARGEAYTVQDDNLPEEMVVKPNKVGPLENGAFPYLGGEEAIDKMTLYSGTKVNLFASEEQFPRLINPVQMSFDTDSRLWVSVWESYPHWNPTKPRKDAILIFPDEDGDGKADECKVFADELNSITGFELWGGGVLVAAPPELWFLKDTDGDDKADFKLRVLQGISSADSHHSANAMVIGPDGWLYFSRGVFNVANFETPTQTLRSGQTGVYRFNPRTYEVEFHFPIGPNPHGDSFDRWGYQFANDGTGGSGCYINIGKGEPNKRWFQQRVRPVPSNGILSSSHFPEEMDGNFLISNAIGFLGVLQLKTSYDGADISGEETDPLVFSDDPNFRPSDLEVGGDGALYIADWHNTLIGHMQHNMRDPNRDAQHGRIYRMTYEGRPLVKPPKMKGKPIAEVVQNFFSRENSTRYRARLELSGRPTDEVVAALKEFTASLNPKNAPKERDEAQALLESLWTFEEHRIPDMLLVERVFLADEPRVRAAAIRSLGHWAGKVSNWQATLSKAAKDDSALVRAEAVKAAVDFIPIDEMAVAEVIFEASARRLDDEMSVVLAYAEKQIDVKKLVRRSLADGTPLPASARDYLIQTGAPADLEKLGEAEDVHRAMLTQVDANDYQLQQALKGLASKTGRPAAEVLLAAIDLETKKDAGNVAKLGGLLAKMPPAELKPVVEKVKDLALNGSSQVDRSIGYVGWASAADTKEVFLSACQSKSQLRDFLTAVPRMNEAVQKQLYSSMTSLVTDLPNGMEPESLDQQQGIEVAYASPTAKSRFTKVVSKFEITIPPGGDAENFTNTFTGSLIVANGGKHRFYLRSNGIAKLFIDDKLVVTNKARRKRTERSKQIDLAQGSHSIRLVYTQTKGKALLEVNWRGQKLAHQRIAGEQLILPAGESIHDLAIQAMASIQGNEKDKFNRWVASIAAGRNQKAAIDALNTLPATAYDSKEVKPLVDKVIGYLSEMPARLRTSPSATTAMSLADKLGQTLSAEESAAIKKRLENLDIRVIALGTVSHRMIYDKPMIVVQAGKPVEFRFSNTDSMPHNFAIATPGSLETVGVLGETTARDADAEARGFVPTSGEILVGSKLLKPGESQAISFDVPKEPGVYPYVCTYPGHWRRMFGALYVVPDFESYKANPQAYLASLDLPIKDELLAKPKGEPKKFEEFVDDIKNLRDRNYMVGRAAFTSANCIGCHQFNGQGQNFGPDLSKLVEERRTPEHILRSILLPSEAIDENYESTKFLLETGDTVVGMITEEDENVIRVVVDPLLKDSVTEIDRDSIEESKRSELSPMPEGLVDNLSKEEILDLIAYIKSGGDPENEIFTEHGH